MTVNASPQYRDLYNDFSQLVSIGRHVGFVNPIKRVAVVEAVLVDAPVRQPVYHPVLRRGYRREVGRRWWPAAEGGRAARPGALVPEAGRQRPVRGEIGDNHFCPPVVAVRDGCQARAGVDHCCGAAECGVWGTMLVLDLFPSALAGRTYQSCRPPR